MIRQPKVAPDTARKGRTSAVVTVGAMIVNAPAKLREIPRRAHQSGAHQPLRPLPSLHDQHPHSRREALTESISTPLAPPRHRGTPPTTPRSATSPPKPRRHRLYRGGHHQANATLYQLAIVRIRFHQPTIDYVARRTTESLHQKGHHPLPQTVPRPRDLPTRHGRPPNPTTHRLRIAIRTWWGRLAR